MTNQPSSNVIQLKPALNRYITSRQRLLQFNPVDFDPPDLPLIFSLHDSVLVLATRMHPDPTRCDVSMECNMELARRVAHQIEQRGYAAWYETSAIGDQEAEIMLGGFSIFRVTANKASVINLITNQLNELDMGSCSELLDCTCSVLAPSGNALPVLTTSVYPRPGVTSEWAMQIYENIVIRISTEESP